MKIILHTFDSVNSNTITNDTMAYNKIELLQGSPNFLQMYVTFYLYIVQKNRGSQKALKILDGLVTDQENITF